MMRREQSGVWRPYHDAVSLLSNRVRTTIAITIVGVAAWLGGCSDGPQGVPPPVASVTVAPNAATMLVPASIQLTATLRDAAGGIVAGRPISWTTSNSAVATVDAGGLVTSVSDGSAAITATSEGVSATAGISVIAIGPVDSLPPQGLIGSNPVLTQSVVSGTAAMASPTLSVADEVTYVSLAPGTIPTGSRATIQRVGVAGLIVTQISDGGFDPMPVSAQPGDSIHVLVQDANGPPVGLGFVVTSRRPPVVVRTNPPRKKRDVPLNTAIVVVFSEPIDGATLTPSSIILLRGTTRVGGTVRFLDPTIDPSHVSVEFVPDASLAAGTEYLLVVTRNVRDLDGEALAAPYTVPFTTGASSTGPPASISISADTLELLIGSTYQVTATVRDAAGNTLTDHPITWSTAGNSSAVTISTTGRLTAVGQGSASVGAAVGNVSTGPGLAVYVLPNPPASVVIAPSADTVAAGDTIFLIATVRDADGRVISGPPLAWTSSNSSVAAFGLEGGNAKPVIGASPGSATITATSGTASGTAAVTVGPPVPIASVTVAPEAATIIVGRTAKLEVTIRDATGRRIGRSYAWTTDRADVATVDFTGLVTGVSPGAATVTATSEGLSDAATITVVALEFTSMSAGAGSTCGIVTTGAAYCWGRDDYGELGDGSWGNPSYVPVAVTGGLTFTEVAAGWTHTCGLATGGAAYCWGNNDAGQLGDGSGNGSSIPVPVGGGFTFTAVSASGRHSCGLDANGRAYCWGWNNRGQLGTGSTDASTLPVAVAGGLTFSAVIAGGEHTCGLTSNGAAYCWGGNDAGQLGNSSAGAFSSVPVAVTGGLTFSAVSALDQHTCGLATSGAAYCWGDNAYGQLGTGTMTTSPEPVAVTGGLTFTEVAAGVTLTCGLATGGAAYCWGRNDEGQLGDGSRGSTSSIPVAVTGGLTFSAVSAGSRHTCGLAAGGPAHCWGDNTVGQLGTGTGVDSSVPIKVAGQP